MVKKQIDESTEEKILVSGKKGIHSKGNGRGTHAGYCR